MKKLLIGMCVILMAASCQQPASKTTATLAAPADTTQPGVTLNGVDQQTALKMIARFNVLKANIKHPKPITVWFSKQQISDMVTMLNAELQQETPTTGTGADAGDDMIGMTDGIRIYFACDPAANDLNNMSVLLVSTKDNGIFKDPSCLSGKKHHDYYTHAMSADPSKSGAVCTGRGSCTGTLLYNLICGQCVDDPNCNWSPHNIPVSQARKMATNFGKDAINTEAEWFDLSMWQTFLKDNTSNGLRIYFATNAKAIATATQAQQATSLRDAFVLTPTELNPQTGTNDDHFDCNQAVDYAKSYENFYRKKRLLGGPNQDNGEICPSNCN